MKVKVVHGHSEYDDLPTVDILVDDKYVVMCGISEPEDANLNRDLKFVYDIPKLMERAYRAGKMGESFKIEELEKDE